MIVVLLVVLLALLLVPGSLAAQRPGEVLGRVVDGSGEPVAGATVRVRETGREAESDAAGSFALRGLEPGALVLEVRSLGFVELERRVRVEEGRSIRVLLRLTSLPVRLAGLEVRAERSGDQTERRIGPEEIRRSGAATLGDLLRGRPGLTVVGRGAGGPQSLRIRGSASDAVLVLVDGVPLNDPVTGEADLSTLPAASIRSVRILAGARSAEHGPRARAGVVLVETGGRVEATEASIGAGSLGLLSGRFGTGGRAASGAWSVGAAVRDMDGGFDYLRPPETGGGEAVRRNADVSLLSLRGRWDGHAAGSELDVRLSAERTERGLPGRSFAPSTRARQEVRRLRGAVSVERGRSESSLRGFLWASGQETRHRDPSPPAGLPYDDRARARDAGLRLDGRVELLGSDEQGIDDLRLGAGAELRRQEVDAGDLLEGAPSARGWGGAHVRGGFRMAEVPLRPGAAVALRIDRAEGGGWTPSHEARLSARGGPLRLHVAHRSAFSPPTLADQFFRQGVGVLPNPDLRGERVRGELEVGLAVAGEVAGGAAVADVMAHRGRVEDLVLWLPDFRFLWSPRNVDAERYGVESSVEWSVEPRHGSRVSIAASHAWSRVHRLDDERLRGVQLPYRPEHASSVRAALEERTGRLAVEGRYTGTRYPRTAEVNALPGFWEIDVSLSRTFPAGGWTIEPHLRIDRLLDRRDSLIFGFPEPGRTVSISIGIRRAGPGGGGDP